MKGEKHGVCVGGVLAAQPVKAYFARIKFHLWKVSQFHLWKEKVQCDVMSAPGGQRQVVLHIFKYTHAPKLRTHSKRGGNKVALEMQADVKRDVAGTPNLNTGKTSFLLWGNRHCQRCSRSIGQSLSSHHIRPNAHVVYAMMYKVFHHIPGLKLNPCTPAKLKVLWAHQWNTAGLCEKPL